MRDLTDKLTARGAEALEDGELLALLLGDGVAGEPMEQLAGRLLDAFGGRLSDLGRADVARLRMAAGIGLKRACRIAAAAEIGRRILAAEVCDADRIATSDDVIRLFRPQIESLGYEECWALYLTSTNRIIERCRISQGGVQGTVVDHRLVVKRALELLATQLILVHNHPSGTAEPSPQDRLLTERLARAAALFDIRLLDHLIIAREGEFSFLRHGLLDPK